MVETHVVTVGLSFGRQSALGHLLIDEIHEVFRGSEAECRSLSARITDCSHDRRPLSGMSVACGLIKDWEELLGA
jgi:hypothetical protein